MCSHGSCGDAKFDKDSEKNEDYDVISITNSVMEDLYENDVPFDEVCAKRKANPIPASIDAFDYESMPSIFWPIVLDNNELSDDDRSENGVSIFSFHDPALNVAAPKLNMKFSDYLMHILLAIPTFIQFFITMSIHGCRKFDQTLKIKCFISNSKQQEDMCNEFGVGIFNMPHWDDSLMDAVLIQNNTELLDDYTESCDELISSDDSNSINDAIDNDLQISIYSWLLGWMSTMPGILALCLLLLGNNAFLNIKGSRMTFDLGTGFHHGFACPHTSWCQLQQYFYFRIKN